MARFGRPGVYGVLAAGLTTLLATPALAQEGWDQSMSNKSQAPLGSRPKQQDPYSAAMEMKQKGNYAEAMPILEQYAVVGRGFEVAQLELGKCYFETAKQDKDEKSAEQKRTLGLGWTLKAAIAGLGTAQEQLVRLYLDAEGVPYDPIEAGKWYYLWKRNPARMQLGAASFDAMLENRLKASLDPAGWTDAQQRADAWRQ